MTTRSNYIYWILLVINIPFAIYFVNGWLFAKPSVSQIPGAVVTENSTVRSEMMKLSEVSGGKPIAVALASSRASICVENKIVDFFKRLRSEKPEVTPFILFPAHISDQDISTLKENLSLDFQVLRMSPALEDYWDEISTTYQSEAIIVVGRDQDLFASQNLPEIRETIYGF